MYIYICVCVHVFIYIYIRCISLIYIYMLYAIIYICVGMHARLEKKVWKCELLSTYYEWEL